MTNIVIEQMPAFRKIYKKLHANEKSKVDEAIIRIVADPTVGEEKKGELAGVFVYKFSVHQQEFLLAYEWTTENRLLLALGGHENFYRDLKQT